MLIPNLHIHEPKIRGERKMYVKEPVSHDEVTP